MDQGSAIKSRRAANFHAATPPSTHDKTLKGFRTLEISRIQSGSVLEFSDNSRYLVTMAKGRELKLINVGAGGVLEQSTTIDHLHRLGQLQSVHLGDEASLYRGSLNSECYTCPRWHQLKPGDVLVHANGSREEVLKIEQIFNLNQQNKRVTSVLRTTQGEISVLKSDRSDRELAGPSAPRVFERLQCLQPGQLTKDESRHVTLPGPLGKILESVEQQIAHIEFALALQAQRIADQAITNYRQRIKSGSSLVKVPYERLELTLAGLKEVHQIGSSVAQEISSLGWLPGIHALRVDNGKLDNIQKMIAAHIIDQRDIHAMIHGTQVLWDRIIEELSDGRADFDMPGLTRFCPTAAALLSLLTDETSLARSAKAFTRFETPEHSDQRTFEQIAAMVAEVNHDESRAEIGFEGTIIDNYYTADYLRRMLAQGGRIITHHDRNEKTGEIECTGFGLYYEHGRIPFDAKGIPDMFRKDPKVACFDLIFISPRASLGAYQRVMDSMIVHLQRTDTQTVISEQYLQNLVAFKLSTAYGWWPSLKVITGGKSSTGKPTYWLCVEAPVDPGLRQKFLPRLRANADDLVAAFESVAKSQMSGRHLEQVAVDPRDAERQKVLDVAKYIRLEASTPTFTRLSIGSANMSAQEFQRGRKILEEGLSGVKGVVSWGATMMLTLIDGEVSGTPRGGAYEILDKVKSGADRHALFLGVTVHNPEVSREIVIPNFNGGKPVLIVYEEPSGNFVTIEDISVDRSARFPTRDLPDKPFWDQEAKRSREIAQVLGEQASPAKGVLSDRFRNIAVFLSGGGTVGREIRALTEEAFQHPARDIHVVLVDSRDVASGATLTRELSSTERYADDAAWLERHHTRARETGRAPYVHVVRSGAELADLLVLLDARDLSNPSIRAAEFEPALSAARRPVVA